MNCEFSRCKEWRGVKECHNNEGFFRLCKRHRKRANDPRVRKNSKLTKLTVLTNGKYVVET